MERRKSLKHEPEATPKDLCHWEYRTITVKRSKEYAYISTYLSFGWELESAETLPYTVEKITLHFKRLAALSSNAQLLHLQREFDAAMGKLEVMDSIPAGEAAAPAIFMGLVGVSSIVGAIVINLAWQLQESLLLMVVGIALCSFSYFLYCSRCKRFLAQVFPHYLHGYEEVYQINRQARALLSPDEEIHTEVEL